MHIAFTLLTAQVLGSIATIIARAVAPDNVGPGDVFPNFSFYRLGDPLDVFLKAWFYVGLFSQILICIGYFLFFRKAQSASRLMLILRNNSQSHEMYGMNDMDTRTYPHGSFLILLFLSVSCSSSFCVGGAFGTMVLQLLHLFELCFVLSVVNRLDEMHC